MTNDRRSMDDRYVTRVEWIMHVEAGQRRDKRIDDHLLRQDDKIDALESTINRAIAISASVIVIIQIVSTVILSRQ